VLYEELASWLTAILRRQTCGITHIVTSKHGEARMSPSMAKRAVLPHPIFDYLPNFDPYARLDGEPRAAGRLFQRGGATFVEYAGAVHDFVASGMVLACEIPGERGCARCETNEVDEMTAVCKSSRVAEAAACVLLRAPISRKRKNSRCSDAITSFGTGLVRSNSRRWRSGTPRFSPSWALCSRSRRRIGTRECEAGYEDTRPDSRA